MHRFRPHDLQAIYKSRLENYYNRILRCLTSNVHDMELPALEGSSILAQDPKELSQASFGVNRLEQWPFYQYAKPKKIGQLVRLSLITPSHGHIEALQLADIVILKKIQTDHNSLTVDIDDVNFEKLRAYLKSYESRETGMSLSASHPLFTILSTLELRADADKWFANYKSALKSKDTVLYKLWSMVQEGTTELGHSLSSQLPLVMSATKNKLYLSSGIAVLDASSGAAVSCLGHTGVSEVFSAFQDTAVFYAAHRSFSTEPAEDFKRNLLSTTDGKMAEVYVYNSGEYITSYGTLAYYPH
jgi:hypothetical protein